MWGKTSLNGVVEPVFVFEDNVTSEKYPQMLNNSIISQLRKYAAFRIMIWQQGGAPPHYGQIVRDYLDDTFFTMDWSSRNC